MAGEKKVEVESCRKAPLLGVKVLSGVKGMVTEAMIWGKGLPADEAKETEEVKEFTRL